MAAPCLFPSLFRDSSDHHRRASAQPTSWSSWCFHPSLGIPLIITGSDGRGCGRGCLFPSLFRDSSDHHFREHLGLLPDKIWFPSLFRDSSDHHTRPRCSRKGCPTSGFHPSLGIPLIITRGARRRSRYLVACFHPSLGIPLIITV